jgi:hypothetical protein
MPSTMTPDPPSELTTTDLEQVTAGKDLGLLSLGPKYWRGMLDLQSYASLGAGNRADSGSSASLGARNISDDRTLFRRPP